MSPTTPNYLYALFNNGQRMTGNYGKLFMTRKDARSWKSKAVKSSKVDGSVQIARVEVSNDWQFIR